MKESRKITQPFYLPDILLVAAPLILAIPILVNGALYFGTPSLQFVPWRAWAWGELLNGHLPLWNPWLGMGAPLAANYQTALFYPPNWFLMVVQWVGGVSVHAWAQTLIVAAHWIWAGWGMARLARQLNLKPLAQTVAGLSFGLSSYLVTRAGFLSINAAVAWLPWVILYTDQIARNRTAEIQPRISRSWIGLALCLTMQLLAGHAQLTWYTLLLAWTWFGVTVLWIAPQEFWRKFGKMALGCVFGFCMAAVQLIPTAEYLLQSQRSTEVLIDRALTYSLWPWRLITLLAPDFFGSPAHGDYWHNVYFWEDAIYIGLLPVVLGVSTGIASTFRSLRIRGTRVEDSRRLPVILVGIALVGFLLALGRYLPVYPFLYRYVPSFDMFQAPARFSIWGVFAFALLAGIAVHHWSRPEGRGLYWTRLATAGALAVMVGAGLAWMVLDDVRLTFVRAAALAGVWGMGLGILALLAPKARDANPPSWWSWAVGAWVALDLLVAGWGMNPAAPLQFYRGEASTGASIKTRLGGHRLFLPPRDEYALKFERFFPVESFGPGDDLQELRSVQLPNLTMLDRIPSANNFDPLVPGRYERWMEYLNSRSSDELAAWLGWMDVGLLERSDPKSDGGIRFDPIQADGRFRWSECAVFVNGETEAWEALTRRNPRGLQPIEGAVVIESSGFVDTPPCTHTFAGDITVVGEAPNRIVLETRSNNPGWLIQADMWYPGWTAAVDGITVPIHRAEFLFRGVNVPAGSHQVILEYRPLSFRIGLTLSLLTGVLLTLIERKVVKVSRIG